MYNGIGLQTPRGSGTNGYIQTNKFFIRSRPVKVQAKEFQEGQGAGGVTRKANKEILEHDRKRQTELKLVVLEETLIEQGYTSAEIAQQLDEARTAMDSTPDDQQDFDSSSGVPENTHQIAAKKERQIEIMRGALGLGDVKEGEAFDRELQEQRKQERIFAYEERQRERELKEQEKLKREKEEKKQKKLQEKEQQRLAKETEQNKAEEVKAEKGRKDEERWREEQLEEELQRQERKEIRKADMKEKKRNDRRYCSESSEEEGLVNYRKDRQDKDREKEIDRKQDERKDAAKDYRKDERSRKEYKIDDVHQRTDFKDHRKNERKRSYAYSSSEEEGQLSRKREKLERDEDRHDRHRETREPGRKQDRQSESKGKNYRNDNRGFQRGKKTTMESDRRVDKKRVYSDSSDEEGHVSKRKDEIRR